MIQEQELPLLKHFLRVKLWLNCSLTHKFHCVFVHSSFSNFDLFSVKQILPALVCLVSTSFILTIFWCLCSLVLFYFWLNTCWKSNPSKQTSRQTHTNNCFLHVQHNKSYPLILKTFHDSLSKHVSEFLFLDAHGCGEEISGGEWSVLGQWRYQTQPQEPRQRDLRHRKSQVRISQ